MGYKPEKFDYNGYFDPYGYYEYSSVLNCFIWAGPVASADSPGYKKAPAGNYWSGDFLNFLTMTRLDILRKLLYGGFRSEDSPWETVLCRAHIPKELSWFFSYEGPLTDGYDIRDYTPLSLPSPGTRHHFISLSVEDSGKDIPFLKIALDNQEDLHEILPEMEDPAITGYEVRVRFDKSSSGVTRRYPSGHLKPVGILQNFSDGGAVGFGLIVGNSLIKKISSVEGELCPGTGRILQSDNTEFVNIIESLNSLRFSESPAGEPKNSAERPVSSGGDAHGYLSGNLSVPGEDSCTNPCVLLACGLAGADSLSGYLEEISEPLIERGLKAVVIGLGSPDLREELDLDDYGVPDDFLDGIYGGDIDVRFRAVLSDLLNVELSGSSARVASTGSSGEGIVFRAGYIPSVLTSKGPVVWTGQLHAFWLDSCGNIRADNGNGVLDTVNSPGMGGEGGFLLTESVDPIITFTAGSGTVAVNEFTTHGHYSPEHIRACDCSGTAPESNEVEISDINPVFEAGQRLSELSPDSRRIFTFLDGNGLDDDRDGKVDESGERERIRRYGIRFLRRVGVADPAVLGDDEPFDGKGRMIAFSKVNCERIKPFLGVGDLEKYEYLDSGSPDHDTRVRNLIQYIRGHDKLPGEPALRPRALEQGKVWKLGDIVGSTPAYVGPPPDRYDLVYGDGSYGAYYSLFKEREPIVYVGSNDGMLHAFRAGTNGSVADRENHGDSPGDEVWAYIPQALLPHLKWLPDPGYGHVFYADLSPRIFDAKILEDDVYYQDKDNDPNWGTFLLLGLGRGGRHISVKEDFSGRGRTVKPRDFHPTYVCIDITRPRNPRVLWERSYSGLGMSFSVPSVVRVSGSRGHDRWFAVFGSGPSDRAGGDALKCSKESSSVVFVVDLATGEPCRRVRGWDWLFDTGVNSSFIGNPQSLDRGLTGSVDAIYMGLSAEVPEGGSAGALYRLDTRVRRFGSPGINPKKWTLKRVFTCGRPVTGDISLSVDGRENTWVYFGTGRAQGSSDLAAQEQDYLLGIRDPWFARDITPRKKTEKEVPETELSDLFYANPYLLAPGGVVTPLTSQGGQAGISSWGKLLSVIRNRREGEKHYHGWYRTLDVNRGGGFVSTPLVLAGMVYFPVFIPDASSCSHQGFTGIHGLYYETGTGFGGGFTEESVSGFDLGLLDGLSDTGDGESNKMIIGSGTPPPFWGIHSGISGFSGIVLLGSGEMVSLDLHGAYSIKSDIIHWREN